MSRRIGLQHRTDGGFTLIELLVVVVIIGVLVTIAIPLYLNYRRGAYDRAAASDLRGAITTLERCNADGNGYPTGVTFTGNVATPCAGQTIVKSSTTTLTYLGSSSGYELQAYSTSGSTSASSYYCYVSLRGGAIVTSTKTFSTSYDNTFTCS